MLIFCLKVLIFCFSFFIVFHLLTRQYLNPYRLYLVFGKKGSGKSSYLTKLALQYRKKGFRVYSNMPDLAIPGARYFDVQKLGDFVPEVDSILLIDEVGMIWDNRNFKNFKPSVRDFFKLQRHYKVIVYMASQTFDVDKKLRDLTDGMYLQSNFLRVFSLGRRIDRHVTLTEPMADQESRITEALRWSPIWTWTLTYIPRYARYFKTDIIPALPQLPYKEVPASCEELPLHADRKDAIISADTSEGRFAEEQL